MKDFLEQLAELEVREPPRDFHRQLHERVNRTLLVQHLIDFLVGGAVWSTLHFLRAAFGWLLFTITGRYPGRGDDQMKK
jgi:hypothetical protein